MHEGSLSPEEDRPYDLLLVLVEKFEQENYPLQTHSTPLTGHNVINLDRDKSLYR
jgi:hypothetical protein